METYIVFLRGINVSGQKKIRMADLTGMLRELGYQSVSTYIQSGNILLATDRDKAEILKSLEEAIVKKYGFSVEILVITLDELLSIYREGRSFDCREGALYFVFILDPPGKSEIKALQEMTFTNEHFSITEKCIFLCCKNGYGNAKCNNNFFERKLGVRATTRNLRTVERMLEMAKEPKP